MSATGGPASCATPPRSAPTCPRAWRSPVRWHDATRVLYERGARLFVEMPPGRVLTNLATAAFPDARAVAVADVGLEPAAALVAREQS